MAFVADASMALAWHFWDERTEVTDAVFARTLEEAIVVPAHWRLELANGILVGERRRRMPAEDALHLVSRLATMTIETDDLDPDNAFEVILPLAREHELKVYDAVYLELAMRRQLPLATLDKDLAAAAKVRAVQVIGR